MSVSNRRSWRDVLPVHPAADLFPMMPAEELRALGADIKKNGLANRIAIWAPEFGKPYQLLDGRNRLDAMEAVGIDLLGDRRCSATGLTIDLNNQIEVYIGKPAPPVGGAFPCR